MASAPAIRFTPLRAAAVLSALLAAAAVAFLVAARYGEQPISLWAAFSQPESTDAAILWLRFRRALLAGIVGAALAASGSTLQSLLRNPLADPFILGVSGGAAVGATLAFALGAGALASVGFLGGLARVSGPSFFAFLGSLGAIALVFGAARARGRTSPLAALLAGVVFNAFAAAVVTCIKTLSSPERLGEILYWLVGTLGYEDGWTLAGAAALQVVAVGAMWLHSGRLNLLALGDEDAAALGVPVERTRWILLLASSLSVAGAVALSGLIGFVGLIVPHLLKLWLGPDQRLLIPASALAGAAFLMLSDLVARLLFVAFPQVQPVGVVTALLGGPFFLFLLRRSDEGFES
jgi:iron complex transport system permease protein